LDRPLVISYTRAACVKSGTDMADTEWNPTYIMKEITNPLEETRVDNMELAPIGIELNHFATDVV